MTEQDWLASTDSERMINFITHGEWVGHIDPNWILELIRSNATDRKLRLYACACCRRILHLLGNQHDHNTIQVAEAVADRLLPQSERIKALRAMTLSMRRQWGCPPGKLPD